MDQSNWQRGASTFVIGLGVGAILGILFAPKQGEDTRDEIAAAVQDTAGQLLDKGQQLARRAQQAVEDTQFQLAEAAEVARQAYREGKAASS